MRALLKNWSLQIEDNFFFTKKRGTLLCSLFFYIYKAQITNYVNNGGFEDLTDCIINLSNKTKFWSGVDTTQRDYLILNECLNNVPLNGSDYQKPKSGDGYISGTFLCDINVCNSIINRNYFRNKLKSNLIFNKTYCVKFYVNIKNTSNYGIDGFGAYFGNNDLDTINYGNVRLTYINPQIQNTNGNIITDTLNWALITGAFVANGSEKYMLLGNFKNDLATLKTQIQPTVNYVWSDVNIDDVSVIDIDLPAFAGPDIWGIPTTTVYLGRPQDVGIDEACMWYKLPNTATAIDTAAGITRTVASTTNTYMVRQDICGNIKYDTVVVYASGVGINELKNSNDKLKIYPQPANEILNLEITELTEWVPSKIKVINCLGQLIRDEEISFKNKTAQIKTNELPNGVYLMLLDFARRDNSLNVSKRFVIAR